MIKVRATNEYIQNNIVDNELRIIPKEGDEFEVSEERYKILVGNNKHKLKFVEKIIDKKTNKAGE